MKVSELRALLERAEGDDEVVLETAVGGAPTRRMLALTAYRGGDWTKGRVILRPEETDVVPVRRLTQLTQVARERLEALKAAHAKLGFAYIPKAREQEWLDGFAEGSRMWFTEEEKK